MTAFQQHQSVPNPLSLTPPLPSLLALRYCGATLGASAPLHVHFFQKPLGGHGFSSPRAAKGRAATHSKPSSTLVLHIFTLLARSYERSFEERAMFFSARAETLPSLRPLATFNFRLSTALCTTRMQPILSLFLPLRTLLQKTGDATGFQGLYLQTLSGKRSSPQNQRKRVPE